MDSDWEAQLDEMNRSKRERPFVYPDLLMGCIAYLQWMIGKGAQNGGNTDGMMGKGTKGPDHNDCMEADLRPGRLHKV